MKQRNGLVELSRFIASVAICVYHYEWLVVGTPIFFVHFYIFVEFFFILTGFYLPELLENDNHKQSDFPIKYTYKKFKKMIIPYVLAYVISAIAYWIYTKPDNLNLGQIFYMTKGELLLLQTSGLYSPEIIINSVTAQIPSLLVASCIVLYIIKYHNALFINIGPIIVTSIYAHILSNYGNLSQWTAFEGVLCVGVLRAIAGVMTGAWVKIVMLGKFQKIREKYRLILLVFLLFVSSGIVWARTYVDFEDLVLFVPLFSLIILLLHIEGKKMEESKIVTWFRRGGAISYEVFLIHYFVCKLIGEKLNAMGYLKGIFLYLALVLLIAMLLKIVESCIRCTILRLQKRIWSEEVSCNSNNDTEE